MTASGRQADPSFYRQMAPEDARFLAVEKLCFTKVIFKEYDSYQTWVFAPAEVLFLPVLAAPEGKKRAKIQIL